MKTPAFVIHTERLLQRAQTLKQLQQDLRIEKLLYSVKACPHPKVIAAISSYVDGFSISSVPELELAKQTAPSKFFQFVSPWIDATALHRLPKQTSNVTFNSLEQAVRLGTLAPDGVGRGLRIQSAVKTNPDPLLPTEGASSKLGVTVPELLRRQAELKHAQIDGLHLHNAHWALSWEPFKQNLLVALDLVRQLRSIDVLWCNLGGGQLVHNLESHLQGELKSIIAASGIRVIIEPGSAFVWDCIDLVSRVVDVFEKGGRTIAILDTSVNHLPFVLDLGLRPELQNEAKSGTSIRLAGCTCFERDVFGDYLFATPPKVGDTVTFKSVGAYSLALANQFNGYPLPTLYWEGSTVEEVPW